MATDLILDIDTSDLKVVDGDLVIDYSDAQNLEDLMQTYPGELKVDPLTGVGVGRMSKQRQGAERLIGEARLQMKRDGWKDIKASHSNNSLTVDAVRSE